MSILDYLPDDLLPLPIKGGTISIASKGCGITTDTCAQCGGKFKRPSHHVAYKRCKGKNCKLHFCSWKCVRDYDREQAEQEKAKTEKRLESIARKKARIEEERRKLDDPNLTAEQRKAIRTRLSHQERDIMMQEEAMRWAEE